MFRLTSLRPGFAGLALASAATLCVPVTEAAVLLNWAPVGNNTGLIKAPAGNGGGNAQNAFGNPITIDSNIQIVTRQATGVFSDPSETVDYIGGPGADNNDGAGATFGGIFINNIGMSSVNAVDKETAILNNDYLSVLVQAVNNPLTIDSYSFDVWRQGSLAGENHFTLYSINGAAVIDPANAESDIVLTASGQTSDVPNQIGTVNATGLNLTLQVGETLEMRLYTFGAGNSNAPTNIIGGTVNGSVVPEPGSLALAALGTGAIALRRGRRGRRG